MITQTNGLAVEWLLERQVVVYRLQSPSRSALTAWSEAALEALASWPKDRPYRAIHDISQSGLGLLYCTAVQNDVFNVGVLPGARSQVEKLVSAHPKWTLSLAMVVSGSLSGHMYRFIYRPNKGLAQLQAKAFFIHEQAVQWLMRPPTPPTERGPGGEREGHHSPSDEDTAPYRAGRWVTPKQAFAE